MTVSAPATIAVPVVMAVLRTMSSTVSGRSATFARPMSTGPGCAPAPAGPIPAAWPNVAYPWPPCGRLRNAGLLLLRTWSSSSNL